ncbi:PaaX family transcriptional regulator [Stappia stellulata]|uniref:PaaX family transcriptional regulator n=1 Tax=Stappia stellulata TaxID=71235 RepID=UPI00040AD048|nr:PaaX family transcriptional regulator C-terminal domain-containing protein [Stappia stellulata]
MDKHSPPDACVAALVDRLQATQPLRVWSLIVTIFGDMVAPRGGEVWAGTLSDLLAEMRIDAAAVRAALSRLARDGWVDRMKVGRLSYYRLSAEGHRAFVPALARVYRLSGDARAAAALRVVVLPEGEERVALRDAALKSGYGTLGPSVLVGTSASPPLEGAGAERCIHLAAEVIGGSAAELAARAFDLAPLAERYRRFIAAFTPLDAAMASGRASSDARAMVARTLLIHDYRRLILRDPMLAADLLPADWPGAEANALTARIYAALRPGAERWIAANGRSSSGDLPARAAGDSARFSA